MRNVTILLCGENLTALFSRLTSTGLSLAAPTGIGGGVPSTSMTNLMFAVFASS
jgi:hypothetical protein